MSLSLQKAGGHNQSTQQHNKCNACSHFFSMGILKSGCRSGLETADLPLRRPVSGCKNRGAIDDTTSADHRAEM
jgi:hypothetical protein